ncbi:MAG: hypothetical protein CM1200mP29_05600 [Verrucomicrobiota bacterium]|nr:MAG: hypothetical protein CM1200mP29_05600 [Verrucomicrobiota bacterium]
MGGEERIAGPSSKPGGYIWSKRNYNNFKLGLDFKMSKRCNRGFFSRDRPEERGSGRF